MHRLHTLLLLQLAWQAAAQTRTATRTGSPTPSSTSSVSFSGTSSPSASITPSVSPTGTPSPTVSFSRTPTPSVTPSSTPFACPVQLTVLGALPQRPLMPAGIAECAGHGACQRDATSSSAGRCACSGNWTGAGCEVCAPGMFQAATCAACTSGVGTCMSTSSSGMCSAATGAGVCSSSQAACTSLNASSPLYRTTTCVPCPGAQLSRNASTGALTVVPCNGRGRCDGYRGDCFCAAGWTGVDCSTPAAVVPLDACDGIACNGNGVCVRGSCTCAPGYSGSACEVRTTARSLFVWRPKAWETCSRVCGRGATQRAVDCLLVTTDVAQNVQNVTAAPSSSCDPFTRPATTQDCRTFECGASFASLVIGIDINPAISLLSDATMNAVATGVVNDVAAVVVAAFPGVIPLAEAQARVYVSSLSAAPITTGTTLVALEVQSVAAASAGASVGNSVTGLLVFNAMTTALSNTSGLVASVGSTYLRRAVALQAGDVGAFSVSNASFLANGIAVLNATTTTPLTPSAVETSLLGTLPPGIIAAIVVGLVVSMALVALIVIGVWRCSLKRGSVKPLGFTGRDRRVSGQGSEIAIVVRKNKDGEVVIVRNDSKGSNLPHRSSSTGMAEGGMGGRRASGMAAGEHAMMSRKGSAVDSIGPRRGSAVGDMGARRGSAVGSVDMGARRGSILKTSNGGSRESMNQNQTRRASFVGRGAAADFGVSRRMSGMRQASPDLTDGSSMHAAGKRASFVHEVGMGGFVGNRAVTRGRLPSDVLPVRGSSRSSHSSGSSTERGRGSRAGRHHGVELHSGAAPGIQGRDDWMPKADDGKGKHHHHHHHHHHHKSSMHGGGEARDLTEGGKRGSLAGTDMRQPSAAHMVGRRSLVSAGAAVVATTPEAASRRRSMERTPMTSPSGVDAGNVGSAQRRLPPLDALPHGRDVIRLGSDLGIIDKWVAAPMTDRVGTAGPTGGSELSEDSHGASRSGMNMHQSSMNDSYADRTDRVADFYAEANEQY